MNLIEQLGGYEKAKERGKRENVLDDHDFNYIQKALLQYRRENNIYEKGDWLINTETGTFGDFVKYIELNSGHKHCLVDIGLCDLAVFCSKNIRHATDEEIKAGYRL